MTNGVTLNTGEVTKCWCRLCSAVNRHKTYLRQNRHCIRISIHKFTLLYLIIPNYKINLIHMFVNYICIFISEKSILFKILASVRI